MDRRRFVDAAHPRPVRPTVFAVVLALFLSVLYDQVNLSIRTSASQDTFGAAWLPYALLQEGTLQFDDILPAMERAYPDRAKYGFIELDGHQYSKFPLTAGVLALPIYAIPMLIEGDVPDTDLPRMARTSSAIMAALAVMLLYLALRPICGDGWARVLAVAFGLGTSAWTLAGANLWQEGPAMLASAAFLAALAYAPRRPRLLLAAGFALGTFMVARPPVIVMVPILAAALLLETRRIPISRKRQARLLAGAAVLGALPVALTGWYNWAVFGAPWSSGYGDKATSRWTGDLVYSLPAGLFALTRGIVPTSPFLALGLLAFAGYRGTLRAPREGWVRLRDEPPILPAAALAAAAYILLMSKWFHWWGGVGPGPRLALNAWPFLLVLLAFACARHGDRRWFRVTMTVSIVWAVALRLVLIAIHSNNFMQELTAETSQRSIFLKLFSIRKHEIVYLVDERGGLSASAELVASVVSRTALLALLAAGAAIAVEAMLARRDNRPPKTAASRGILVRDDKEASSQPSGLAVPMPSRPAESSRPELVAPAFASSWMEAATLAPLAPSRLPQVPTVPLDVAADVPSPRVDPTLDDASREGPKVLDEPVDDLRRRLGGTFYRVADEQ